MLAMSRPRASISGATANASLLWRAATTTCRSRPASANRLIHGRGRITVVAIAGTWTPADTAGHRLHHLLSQDDLKEVFRLRDRVVSSTRIKR
jgi:hypothetical protein